MFKQNRLSLIIVLSIIFTISYIEVAQKMWKREHRVIFWDVKSYYAYLPSIVIHQDPFFDFVEDYPDVYENKFWFEKAENGNRVIITSMGLAMLYSPFFILGHIFSHILGYPTTGYSSTYFFFMLLGSLFYVSLGFFTLRKVLLDHFSDLVTSTTLALVFFGTNLFWYSIYEATMSHAYSFALFSFFIYFTIKWHNKKTYGISVLLGLISGLIVLVRPTNILIILFFILYDVKSFNDLKKKFFLFIDNYKKVLIIILFAFIVFLPQLVYWKYVTGSWLYYSYGDRGNFYFSNPQLLNGLFSYRKGWFIYTPIMLFAVLSIPLLLRSKELKKFFVPISLFVAANIYVVLSWWSWWYGGSFGLRAFIESYSLLALPLAALVSSVINQKRFIKIPALILIIVFGLYGLFANIQYYNGAIHWDSMTKAAYWSSFGRVRPHPDFGKLISAPDYESALLGLEDHKQRPNNVVDPSTKCDMETLDKTGNYFLCNGGEVLLKDGSQQTNTFSRSGSFSVKVGLNKSFALEHRIKVKPGAKLEFEIWRDKNAPKEASLVFSAQDANVFYKRTNYVTDKVEGWHKISYYLEIPMDYPDSIIVVYLWNPESRMAYFDDYAFTIH